jgi:hypothetical protein
VKKTIKIFVVLLFACLTCNANAAPVNMACQYIESRHDLTRYAQFDDKDDSFSFVLDIEAKTVNGFNSGEDNNILGPCVGKVFISDTEIKCFSPSIEIGDITISRLDGRVHGTSSYRYPFSGVNNGDTIKIDIKGHCAPLKQAF